MDEVYSVNKISSREKILKAADRIFREEGLSQVTTRRIAAELGITAMAIYRHFKNKDALLQALVNSGFELWERRLAAAIAKKKPYQRLVNALRAYREFAVEERRYFKLMYLTPRGRVPLAPVSLSASPSPAFSLVIAAVQKCMETGELAPSDPAQTILLIWSAAHGLTALHFTGRFGYDDEMFAVTYDRTTARLLQLLKL